MSSHASNECRAPALSQGETAAPPQGASPSPWRDTVLASGQRSPRSNLRPPPRCPGRDTSGHTSRGVTCDEALPQEENAAPPRAKCPSPLLVATATRGTRTPAFGQRPSSLYPSRDSSSSASQEVKHDSTALDAGPSAPPAGGSVPPMLSSAAPQRALDRATLRDELPDTDSHVFWRYDDGPRLTSDAARGAFPRKDSCSTSGCELSTGVRLGDDKSISERVLRSATTCALSQREHELSRL